MGSSQVISNSAPPIRVRLSNQVGSEKGHYKFSTPQKEKLTRKKKIIEKARSSIGRSSEKSHNTNTKFHFREVTISSKDYKIFLYILENYNQQSCSPHLKKLQSAKPFLHQPITTGPP